MNLIINLQEPSDSHALEIYYEILANQEELKKDGIQIHRSTRKSLSPDSLETIVFAIAGGVFTHYIVKFIDFVMEKVRTRKYYSVNIVILHNKHYFIVPEQKQECILYFERIEKEQKGE